MFGACISYLILLADLYGPVVQSLSGEKHDDAGSGSGSGDSVSDPASGDSGGKQYNMNEFLSRAIVIWGLAGVAYALCLLRRISALKYSAGVAVLAVLFTVE